MSKSFWQRLAAAPSQTMIVVAFLVLIVMATKCHAVVDPDGTIYQGFLQDMATAVGSGGTQQNNFGKIMEACAVGIIATIGIGLTMYGATYLLHQMFGAFGKFGRK